MSDTKKRLEYTYSEWMAAKPGPASAAAFNAMTRAAIGAGYLPTARAPSAEPGLSVLLWTRRRLGRPDYEVSQ
jgi:hypothetical protein